MGEVNDLDRAARHGAEANKEWKKYYRSVYPTWWAERAKQLAWSPYDAMLLDLLDVRPRQLVLECGIGTGERYALRVAERGARLCGVDLSLGLLRECQRNAAVAWTGAGGGPAIRVQQADIEALPYPDATFDRVYSFSSLWYVPSLPSALREMVRVAKPGGMVMFDMLNALHVTPALAYLATLAKRAMGRVTGRWSPHSPLAIRRLLRAAPVTWEVKGFGVLLPTALPLLGERADIAGRVPLLRAGLRDSPLRYLGAKLVYVCRRTAA